jgi:hypothetical protein
MRGQQIYGRKFQTKVGAPKFTDLNFIQTLVPPIFKNMMFLQWSKNKSKIRGPKINKLEFHPNGGVSDF